MTTPAAVSKQPDLKADPAAEGGKPSALPVSQAKLDARNRSFVKENFALLSRVAKCIAKQFGPNCETVLHDLTLPYDHTIVAIENGHVTNRKVGDSGTNTGLELLRGTVEATDRFNYVNQTQDGKILRSSSLYFTDDEGCLCGSLCINFDITDFVAGARGINYFANISGSESLEEFFTGNVDTLLDAMLAEAVRLCGKSCGEMTKEDKVAVVKHLDAKGAFLIKKSAEKIAKFLNVSKFTLYNYLGETREGLRSPPPCPK